MRIAINTRFLLPHKLEGFGWFTYEVVSRIVKAHPEHDFYFFFDRKYDPKFIFADNVTPVVLHPQARHPILFKIWFNWSVARALKKHKIDLFFSPDGYLSLNTKVKQVGVIHDLNFEHYPEDVPTSARKYLKKYTPLFAKKANHLLTVSHFSKQDIINLYHIPKNKITVAYNGASEIYRPLSLEHQTEIKEKYAEGQEYFIYVGALHARKNIQRMLEAFQQFKSTTQSKTQLIVVGESMWNSLDESLNFKDVIFTGHLSIDVLSQLVASAKALVLVSYFEGFGIPIVEAMRAGTAVITSNVTALPEIANGIAILVNPFSVDEIAQGMQQMDSDTLLRLELEKKGLAYAQSFHWERTSKIVWESLNDLL